VQEGVRHDPAATVWRCSTCDLVYGSPRPSGDELAHYYATTYRDEYGAVAPEELRRIGLDDAAARARRLTNYLQPTASILDVGAGVGTFLAAIAGRVGAATGVEPDERSRVYIGDELGLPAVATLSELERGSEFDLITLFHVLEHVLDPASFLRELAALLRPGGALVIEVPNIDDALVSVYRSAVYRAFYFQKAHLYYFSATTLARASAEAGLSGKVSFVQRYGLRNHLHWLASGQPGGDALYSDVVSESADAAYRDSLVRSGRADTLWLVANTTGSASASATNP